MENGTCQLRGRVEQILRRKTNLKDVKIYKPQQLSSGDDQDGLSAAQNAEVETPLSAAVLTAVPQKGEATRPPPNCRHEQTRDTAHSPFSTSVQEEATRPSVHEAPQQGDTTRPLANSMHARDPKGGKQPGLDPTACLNKP